MDYTKYFRRGSWIALGRYYATHPTQLKSLLNNVKKYASREGLTAARDELSVVCSYVRDVCIGKYRDYNMLNLSVIVGALVYVITPVDAIPDFVPAGLIDDSAILLWATKEFAEELDRYKAFRKKQDDARRQLTEDNDNITLQEDKI